METKIKEIMRLYAGTWIIAFFAGIITGIYLKGNIADIIFVILQIAFVLQMLWVLFLHWSKRYPSYSEFVLLNRESCLWIGGITASISIYNFLYVMVQECPRLEHDLINVIIVISLFYTLLMIKPKKSYGEKLSMWIGEYLYVVYILMTGTVGIMEIYQCL